jgi:hypothetical protein
MSTLNDILQKKAAQEAAAKTPETTIATGMASNVSSPDTPEPQATPVDEPNQELAAKAVKVYHVEQNLPFIAMEDGSNWKVEGQFYYATSEEQVNAADYFAKKGMLSVVTIKK